MVRPVTLVLLLALFASLGDLSNATSSYDHSIHALKVLQSHFYDPDHSNWGCGEFLARQGKINPQRSSCPTDMNWWNCANTLEALANVLAYAPNASISHALSGIPSSVYDTATISYLYHLEFAGNDDKLWWALAYLRVHDVSQDRDYLNRSKAYFHKVSEYWDDTCGGGVWWNLDKTYKNAITNELFLYTAIRLYDATKDKQYLDWARKEWRWFNASSMINGKFLINDGLTIDESNRSICHNNGQTTWTYNQGVILPSLVRLQALGMEGDFIPLMKRIVDAVKTLLVNPTNHVLRESCETTQSCDSDDGQFKGIFMRYLAYATSQLDSNAWMEWVQHNANVVWSEDQTSQGLFGLEWSEHQGTPGNQCTSCILQTSALDLLSAAEHMSQ